MKKMKLSYVKKNINQTKQQKKFKINKKILLESAKKKQKRTKQFGVFPTTQNNRAHKKKMAIYTHNHTHWHVIQNKLIN